MLADSIRAQLRTPPRTTKGVITVKQFRYDLWHDATGVGADLVVETWISHGPRATDSTFSPQLGDRLLVGDDEEPPCKARVIRRDGNRVWIQLELGQLPAGSSGHKSDGSPL
jgi:hypothetical protein